MSEKAKEDSKDGKADHSELDISAIDIWEESAFKRLSNFLSKYGVETRGITPVPVEDRVDKRLYQMFFIWFSANFNILIFSTGATGPAFFSLGLRASILTVLVVDVITSMIPAAFAVFGPKLGMRAMVQSRFSWGYYGATVPSVLNVFACEAFLILSCIAGGQALSAISDNLRTTLGIVIIGVLSLVVTFLGYKVIHLYESIAWIPNAIAFPIMLGLGWKHLRLTAYSPAPPATTSSIMSFGSFVAASVITWCTLTPDYGVYHDASASSWRIFIYTYLAFLLSNVSCHMIGAAFAATAPGVLSYEAGFDRGNNLGGLVEAILAPLGGFGKFLLVLITLSVVSTVCPTIYTFGTSLMTIHESFAKIPRYIFAIISTAIAIPLSIIGATRFFATMVNLVSLMGYWSSSFAAIVLCEHFVFRRSFSAYKVENWNQPRHLPPGFAAVGAFLCSIGVIVPAMRQSWYIGPIARSGAGDLGVLCGFFVAGISYLGLRTLEKRVWPGHSS